MAPRPLTGGKVPALILVAVCLLLAACSSPQADQQLVDQAYIDEGVRGQQAAIDDGIVDRSDYENAVAAVKTCLNRFGIETGNDRWDPVRQQGMQLSYTSAHLPDAELTEAVDGCRAAHITLVANEFEAAHQPRMTSELHRELVRCLKQRGVPAPTTVLDPYAFDAAVPTESKADLGACIQQSQERHPETQIRSFP